jgi:hypothetical protein
VAADLIGPWKIQIPGQELVFNALTCIDPVSCLLKICLIDNKSSDHVSMKFENNWLARYPRPLRCIHDAGGEFTGKSFQDKLFLNRIKDSPTTIKNPQANAICELVHQTIANILCTHLHVHPPQNIVDANAIMDTCLATAMHATRVLQFIGRYEFRQEL